MHDHKTRLRLAVTAGVPLLISVTVGGGQPANASWNSFPSSQQVARVLGGVWRTPQTYKPDYGSTDRCRPPYWRAGNIRVASYPGSALDGYRRGASVTRVIYKNTAAAKGAFAAVKSWVRTCRSYSYYGGSTDTQPIRAAKVGAQSVALREWECGYEGGTQCDHATVIIARTGKQLVETRYSLGDNSTTDDPTFTVNVSKTVKLARLSN